MVTGTGRNTISRGIGIEVPEVPRSGCSGPASGLGIRVATVVRSLGRIGNGKSRRLYAKDLATSSPHRNLSYPAYSTIQKEEGLENELRNRTRNSAILENLIVTAT